PSLRRTGLPCWSGLPLESPAWSRPQPWSAVSLRHSCFSWRGSPAESGDAGAFQLRPKPPGDEQPEHAYVALERPCRMRYHRRPVPLDQEMAGPSEEVANSSAKQSDERIDGEKARQERQHADSRAEDVQN